MEVVGIKGGGGSLQLLISRGDGGGAVMTIDVEEGGGAVDVERGGCGHYSRRCRMGVGGVTISVKGEMGDSPGGWSLLLPHLDGVSTNGSSGKASGGAVEA